MKKPLKKSNKDKFHFLFQFIWFEPGQDIFLNRLCQTETRFFFIISYKLKGVRKGISLGQTEKKTLFFLQTKEGQDFRF